MNTQKLLKLIIPFLLICLIVAYSLWQLRQIIDGPTLSIISPAAAENITEPEVKITGHAEQVDWLFLNGRQIFTDEKGYFSEEVFAAPGVNMLQLKGKDKFGRITIKNIELVYQATSTTAL